jgi:membrane protein DedA with SNARE-associated domain
MTPAAALRDAQLKMKQNKQWSAPYYWAGFVLQGEYTNHITVNRRPWLRPALLLLLLLILISATLLILQRRKRRYE